MPPVEPVSLRLFGSRHGDASAHRSQYLRDAPVLLWAAHPALPQGLAQPGLRQRHARHGVLAVEVLLLALAFINAQSAAQATESAVVAMVLRCTGGPRPGSAGRLRRCRSHWPEDAPAA